MYRWFSVFFFFFCFSVICIVNFSSLSLLKLWAAFFYLFFSRLMNGNKSGGDPLKTWRICKVIDFSPSISAKGWVERNQWHCSPRALCWTSFSFAQCLRLPYIHENRLSIRESYSKLLYTDTSNWMLNVDFGKLSFDVNIKNIEIK